MMFLHKSNQNTIAFEASSHYAYSVHLAAGHACVWARWPGGLFQHHGGEGWLVYYFWGLFQHTELEHTPSNLYQQAIKVFLS